jgi:hypothetical protein
MLNAVNVAEEKIGKPPLILEVFVEMKHLYPELPINNVYEGSAAIACFLREDWLYINDKADRCSLV